jgi:hypothetical protein
LTLECLEIRALPSAASAFPVSSDSANNTPAIVSSPGLTPQQIQQLNYTQFQYLTVDEVPDLTTAQIASIPDGGWFATMSAGLRAALTLSQVQALNVGSVGISLLTPTQCEELTTSQIQQLSYHDFAYVPVDLVPELTVAQVASIPDGGWFVSMSPAARAALTVPQVQALNTSTIGLSALTPSQCAELTISQVQKVSYQYFQYLPADLVPELTVAQITTIHNGWLASMSADARAALTTAQVQALDVGTNGLDALTPSQCEELTPSQVQEVSFHYFQYIPVDLVPELTVAQITTIHDGWLGTMSADARAALTIAQVRALDVGTNGLDALTPSQREELTPSQLQEVSFHYFQYVPVDLVPELSVAQIASIPDSGWFETMTPPARAALTATQVQALNTRTISISLLTPGQREELTTSQVQQLPFRDFQYLPVDRIPELTVAQIASIPDVEALETLSPAALGAFTQAQIQALNPSILAALRPTIAPLLVQVNGNAPTFTSGVVDADGEVHIGQGQSIMIGTGDVVSGSTIVTAPAFGLSSSVTVSYGDSTGTQTLTLVGDTYVVPGHHYNTTGNYILTVSVVNHFTSASLSMVVSVLSAAQFADTFQSRVIFYQPPSSTSGPVADANGNTVDTVLTLPPGSSGQATTLSVASYLTNPATNSMSNIQVANDPSAGTATPVAFFDLRVSGLNSQAGPTLVVTFTVSWDSVHVPNVYFLSGGVWTRVQNGVNGGTPEVHDNLNGTVNLIFTFNDQSTPVVWNLSGTVFTVAVPAPAAPPTVASITPGSAVASAAGLPAFPTFSTPAAFSSNSQVTLVLRVSQTRDLSSSNATVSANSAAAITAVADESGADVVTAALDIDWLLNMLDRTVPAANVAPGPEGATRTQPGQEAQPQQQQQPPPLPRPQNQPERDDELSAANRHGLDLLFADGSHGERNVFCLEEGSEWIFDSGKESSMNWDPGLLLAAFAGLGSLRVTAAPERRRHRPYIQV